MVQPGRTSPASYTTSWVRSREPSLTMWRLRDATQPAGSETERPQDGATIPAGSSEALRWCCGGPGGVCGCPACARWASRPTQILPKRDSLSERLQAERTPHVSPVKCRPLPGENNRPNSTPSRLPGAHLPACQTPSVLGRISWRLVRQARLKPQSDSQGVPSAQVLDRLAVLPLDGILEKVSKSAAGGDAGDVGHAAPCAH